MDPHPPQDRGQRRPLVKRLPSRVLRKHEQEEEAGHWGNVGVGGDAEQGVPAKGPRPAVTEDPASSFELTSRTASQASSSSSRTAPRDPQARPGDEAAPGGGFSRSLSVQGAQARQVVQQAVRAGRAGAGECRPLAQRRLKVNQQQQLARDGGRGRAQGRSARDPPPVGLGPVKLPGQKYHSALLLRHTRLSFPEPRQGPTRHPRALPAASTITSRPPPSAARNSSASSPGAAAPQTCHVQQQHRRCPARAWGREQQMSRVRG